MTGYFLQCQVWWATHGKRTKSISSDEASESAESSAEDELDDDAADEIADAATDDEDFPVSLSIDSGSRLVKEEKEDTYLFIRDESNSDLEISEIPRPQSVKRPHSPDLEETKPINISDDETAFGSPHRSPQLRPVTSSFSYDPAANNLSMPPVASGSGSSTTTTALSPPVTSRLGNYTPFSATVKAYVQPPPREGLHVPKSKRNIWDLNVLMFAVGFKCGGLEANGLVGSGDRDGVAKRVPCSSE
ncbi:hypothetical protein C8R45DRAFT_937615 [Mycena sanguinolenta]|nr:hypothetical protein C8R45DRAFT_937615 [Mycena sanguinolenta]